jgi:acyl-coenzyme A thioesterase PaaI-like protein
VNDEPPALHPAALRAVARTRAEGLHLWGRMLGLRLAPDTTSRADGEYLLQAESLDGRPDVTTLATLVDVGAGYTIRGHLGGGVRLATTSMSLQPTALATAPATGPLTCRSRLFWLAPDGDRALIRGYVTDATGAPIATATVWMVVLGTSPAGAVVPMPWDGPGPGESEARLTAADLTEPELAFATSATAAIERSGRSGRPVAEELLDVTWTPDGTDRLIGTVSHGPHLGNRVGNVQGGALFGLTATAAGRLVGEGQQLADGSVQFLRPGTGGDLRVVATTVRRGRTVSAVDAVVECDGRVLVSAQFTLMA